ncbi:hypothetical protein SAMN04487884_1434 [Butyrivibrio fibrisolvens]|uniref:Uncharacterized protein n=1 Tax=Butyrivibrio fibrisolvens TaxID=831 RepID=A0A1H9X4E7_BUTFI|nr:hypothetical protein SAMN04487884_1434 [Butyrivibrio fibrisolvens]
MTNTRLVNRMVVNYVFVENIQGLRLPCEMRLCYMMNL